MNIPTSMKTNRLYLRKLEETDAEKFLEAALETYRELNLWYGGIITKPGLTLDKVKSYISDCNIDFEKKSFIQYGVFNHIDRLVGVGSLHHLDWDVPKGRIGYWVRTSEAGQGYATHIANALTRLAIDELEMKRLEIRTATENKASEIIPKKLKYQFNALFLKNKKGNNGEVWDLNIYVRYDTKDLPDLSIEYIY